MHRPLALLLSLVLAVPASAWNRPGHMVTAAMAYHRLEATNPEAWRKAIGLLTRHPEYNGRWLEKVDGLEEASEE